MSGRELGTGERWFHGALAPLDIIPGAMAVKKFSGVTKVTSFAGDFDILGKTTTLTNKAQSSMQKVSDLALTAKTETIARLKQADAFIVKKEKEVLQKVVDGALGTARAVDETITNTHVVENTMKDMLSKFEGMNIGKSEVSKGTVNKIDSDTIKNILVI